MLSLADAEDRNPLASAFITAAESLGFPVTDDIGGEFTTGVGWNQLTVKGHVRDDAATAYLGSLANVKIDLLVRTEVQKLHIENGRCKGAQITDRIVRPVNETLLCAGAINSPRILMLSGIGPADHISSFGIRVAVDLPDVGSYLEDHLLLADRGQSGADAPTNPLGVKGAGEAGTVGSLSAGVNAIVDALSVLGIRHIDTLRLPSPADMPPSFALCRMRSAISLCQRGNASARWSEARTPRQEFRHLPNVSLHRRGANHNGPNGDIGRTQG